MTKNDSADPERFGAGSHPDDRLPFFEPGVRIGAFTVLGRQPYPTAANRRPTRLVGAGRIGAGTVIGCHAVIYAGAFIGRDCCIGDHATIREDVRTGDRCVIGVGADLQYGVTLADDVRVLNQCQVTGNSVIGRGSFLGPGLQSANDLHVAHFGLDDYRDRGQAGVTIGEYVFIGAGCLLLPGVKIGDRAIVGAGSLITRDVPPEAKVMGRPARGVSDEKTMARISAQVEECVAAFVGGR